MSKGCTRPGCTDIAHSKGLCRKDYDEQRRRTQAANRVARRYLGGITRGRLSDESVAEVLGMQLIVNGAVNPDVTQVREAVEAMTAGGVLHPKGGYPI